jgi:hypothetical protein
MEDSTPTGVEDAVSCAVRSHTWCVEGSLIPANLAPRARAQNQPGIVADGPDGWQGGAAGGAHPSSGRRCRLSARPCHIALAGEEGYPGMPTLRREDGTTGDAVALAVHVGRRVEVLLFGAAATSRS